MTRNAKPSRDPTSRPLPASLTRFLSDPTSIVGPSHEDRARPGRSASSTSSLAFRLAIGWAVLYNVVGGAILWWLWSTMG